MSFSPTFRNVPSPTQATPVGGVRPAEGWADGDIVSHDEARVAYVLAEVTLNDEVYSRAMTAILHGSTAVRHRKVLKSRRLRAIARLVEEARFARAI